MIDALDELKTLRQWVAWRIEWDAKNERKTKPPYNIHTDTRADKTNPEHWAGYDEVISYAYHKGIIQGHSGGAGFVFTDKDCYCGIDLDHVIKNDELIPEAQEIVALMDSYTEYSYSGDGLHILVKLNEPLASFCNKHKADLGIASRIEIYDSAWYFTVSGKPYGEPKPIAERTQQCKQLCATFFTKKPAEKITAPETTATTKKTPLAEWKYNPEHYNAFMASLGMKPEDLSDTELWQRMFDSEHGRDIQALYYGDISAYGSDHSRADLALCSYLAYWTNGDKARIDKMFRQSGLMRDKWQRSDYQQRTINQALSDKQIHSHSTTDNTQSNNSETNEKCEGGNGKQKQDKAESSNHREGERDYSTLHLAHYLASQFRPDIDSFALYKNRKTGFDNFDKDNSLYPGLYVIGGVSSVGKTTFCHQIADNLARAGEYVLYFSLEQTDFELASKGIARISALENIQTAKTAIQIRNGQITEDIQRAIRIYQKFADHEFIITSDPKKPTTANTISKNIQDFIVTTGVKPVVFLDYLQILRPSASNTRMTTKEAVDDTVQVLKQIQADHGLVMFVICSFNRQNYLTVADFEAFKESGLIEYSADVVFALQLLAMNADLLDTQNKLIAKRDFLHEEKKRTPRDIELLVLKNRYGKSFARYFFTYDARYDLFSPSTITEDTADSIIQARAKPFEDKHKKDKDSGNKRGV